ncbi:hypothetical protein ABPG75_002025 [Micractinium tetrahymenae]
MASCTSATRCSLAAPSARHALCTQKGRVGLPRRPCAVPTTIAADASLAPRRLATPGSARLPQPSASTPEPCNGVSSPPVDEPRFVYSGYTSYGAGGIDAAWCAPPTLRDVTEGACKAYAGDGARGVTAAAYRRCPRLPGDVTDAIAAAQADPARVAGHLSCIIDRWGAQLQERAPSGSSAVLLISGASLLQLTELAAGCAEVLTTSGQLVAALRTSLAALELLSHLHFASRPDAACFQAVTLQLSRAATTAIQAGAAPSEWQVVGVLRVAAQADAHLRLPTWLGHGFAAADARLTDTKDAFQTEAAAVEYAERHSTLLAKGHKQLAAKKYKKVLEHPLSHPGLTPAHLDRLLAAERAVPAELTSTINTWLRGWQLRVEAKRGDLAKKAAKRSGAAAQAAPAASAAVPEPAHAVAAAVAA